MSTIAKITSVSFIAITLFSITPCEAKPVHPILLKAKKCLKNPNASTTRDVVECHMEAAKDWDKEVNVMYKKLMAMQGDMTPEAKAALKKSQQAWMTFRDQEFNFFGTYYYYIEGTVWQIVAAQMKADFVKDRVEELYRILNSTDMARNPRDDYSFDSDQ